MCRPVRSGQEPRSILVVEDVAAQAAFGDEGHEARGLAGPLEDGALLQG
jgi:hypothetical protein